MNRVIVIYGLPNAGKSTICKYLHSKFKSKQIRIDNIWEQTFSHPDYSPEQAKIVFDNLITEIKKELYNKTSTIIIEGVFASAERLITIKEMANSGGYQFSSILLFGTLDDLLLRNKKRNRNLTQAVSDDVINFFKKRFNSFEFCDLAINSSKISKEKTKQLINTLF